MTTIQDTITQALTGGVFGKRELHEAQIADIARAIETALAPRPLSIRKDQADVLAWAKELASPDWCLFVPGVAKTAIMQLVGIIEAPATRTVTTPEQLDALPLGAVVQAHWDDPERPDHVSMRGPDGDVANGGYSVAGGLRWRAMASWGATLIVVSIPGVAL